MFSSDFHSLIRHGNIVFLGFAPFLRFRPGTTRILDESTSLIVHAFFGHLVLQLARFPVIRESLVRTGMAWPHNHGGSIFLESTVDIETSGFALDLSKLTLDHL